MGYKRSWEAQTTIESRCGQSLITILRTHPGPASILWTLGIRKRKYPRRMHSSKRGRGALGRGVRQQWGLPFFWAHPCPWLRVFDLESTLVLFVLEQCAFTFLKKHMWGVCKCVKWLILKCWIWRRTKEISLRPNVTTSEAIWKLSSDLSSPWRHLELKHDRDFTKNG